jgi:hypothetical protein
VKVHLLGLATLLILLLFSACADPEQTEEPAATFTPTAASLTATLEPMAPASTVTMPASAITVTPSARLEPTGLPIATDTPLGTVVGTPPNRTIDWQGGLRPATYSTNDQTSDDPVVATRGGWNCRVHQEYEAAPAVDWYIANGTSIRATMDGTARLFHHHCL